LKNGFRAPDLTQFFDNLVVGYFLELYPVDSGVEHDDSLHFIVFLYLHLLLDYQLFRLKTVTSKSLSMILY